MSDLSDGSHPGADRPWSLYAMKRRVLAPVVWHRRRALSDRGEIEHLYLARSSYSRGVTQLMDTTGIDPKFLHRADLDADSIVVDVGAAAGIETAEVVDLYDPTIYAFEPAPDTFPVLAARFADTPKVITLPYGLGDADATLTMALAGHGSTVYGVERGDFPTASVEIRDIAAVIDELGLDHIDLIKINIEGAEYDLLDRLLAAGLQHRIRYFLIQFHEWHPYVYLRRWRFRRAIARTHQEVWNFPWCWELWCAKDQPPPAVPEFTTEEIEAIVAELKRLRDLQEAGAEPE